MSLQPSLTLALAAHWHWGQTRLLLFTEQFKRRKTVIFFSHTAKKCFAKCWFSKKKFENVMSYELHFSVFVWDRLIFQSISCSYHFKNLQAEAEMFLFDVGLHKGPNLFLQFCYVQNVLLKWAKTSLTLSGLQRTLLKNLSMSLVPLHVYRLPTLCAQMGTCSLVGLG